MKIWSWLVICAAEDTEFWGLKYFMNLWDKLESRLTKVFWRLSNRLRHFDEVLRIKCLYIDTYVKHPFVTKTPIEFFDSIWSLDMPFYSLHSLMWDFLGTIELRSIWNLSICIFLVIVFNICIIWEMPKVEVGIHRPTFKKILKLDNGH